MIPDNANSIDIDRDLTILIPTWNRPMILRRTLEELRKGGFGKLPLLVYDDASTLSPSVVDVVQPLWEKADVIRSEIKRGQAFGRNRLLDEVKTRYALLLDDDSWPEDRDKLIEAWQEAHKRGAACATFQYRSLGTGELSHTHIPKITTVNSFLGGAVILHVDTIRMVNGFRESLVFGYEEPDLSLRLWAAGKNIVFFPNVIFAHNQHYTPDEFRNFKEYDYLYSRNAILYCSLNFPILLGIPYGLISSVRRFFYHKRNYFEKFLGILCGLYDSFKYSKETTKLSISQFIDWHKIKEK